MKHIYEHGDVMMEVTYHHGSDGVPVFENIQVLGDGYKPTGPNMLTMLDRMLLWVTPDTEAMTVLSAIAEELPTKALT